MLRARRLHHAAHAADRRRPATSSRPKTLAKTKKGVRIINCARGGLVDEAALRAALDIGHVAGAAFDVFAEEPATDNPLFGHPNVVCTPHLGASTTEAQENVALQVAEQMSDYLMRGAITNAVNFPSISAEEAPKLKPFIALAEKLGSFAGQLTDDRHQARCTITYEGARRRAEHQGADLGGDRRPAAPDARTTSTSSPRRSSPRSAASSSRRSTRAAEGDYESLITLSRDHRPAGRVRSAARCSTTASRASCRHQGHQDRRRIHPVDDLCDQRGQAGLHRPLRQPARRGRRQHRDLRSRPRPEGGSAIALVAIDGPAPEGVLAKVGRIPGVKQAKALKF